MLKNLQRILFLVLILYSSFIVLTEFFQGQDAVRHYVTDIKGEAPFHGVNTTLTTIILVLTAYNFGLSFLKLNSDTKKHNKTLLFAATQFFIFLILAFDERFMLHESIGDYFGRGYSLFHMVIALIELGVFMYCKQIKWPETKGDYYLIIGGFLFVIMTIIDSFGASRGLMRLSLEDISKFWAIAFLFMYSYQFLKSINDKSI
jgi:hypothetical protein